MPIEAYTEAIEDARIAAERDFGIVLRWIYDIPGESGMPAADATLSFALNHRADALVGFGLGGPEIGVPAAAVPAALRRRPAGRAAQRAARRRDDRPGDGLGRAAAARRRADRARHLGRQDPELLDHLAETGVPLEVCPSSNIATRAVATLDEHPIRAFRDAGVTITVNSDDPSMFGTSLNQEYEIAARLLDLDAAGVADLAARGRARVVRRSRGQGRPARRDRDLLRGPEDASGPAISYVAGPDHWIVGGDEIVGPDAACRRG